MTPANDNTPRPAWFDDLLLKYRPHIVKQCAKRTTEVEDLVQDVMLRAMARWHQYRPGQEGGFPVWLTYLVRAIHSERARKGSLRTIPIQEWHDVTAPPAQEHAADIGMALRPCTPRQRGIMMMHGQGFTCREIGAAVGLSRTWAMKLLHDGRELTAAANDAANDNVKQDKKAA